MMVNAVSDDYKSCGGGDTDGSDEGSCEGCCDGHDSIYHHSDRNAFGGAFVGCGNECG
jgi:hypothetical protein